MIQQCKEIGTLSARGMTFFASTGDQGATNGRNGCGNTYNVNFPASCPYVTAVGATTGFSAGDEVVCNSHPSVITTGGGFSTIFNEGAGFNLDFQKGQVEAYRDKMSSSLEGFPPSGRGLPDISAPGTNYIVKIDSSNAVLDGTSASSPVMAGITARIMLENNSSRLGCINHVLYQNESIFFDVIEGQNSGDGKTAYCPPGANSRYMGFAATSGWDAASGVGTIGTPDGYASYEAVLTSSSLPAFPPTQAPSAASNLVPSLFRFSRTTLIFVFLIHTLGKI